MGNFSTFGSSGLRLDGPISDLRSVRIVADRLDFFTEKSSHTPEALTLASPRKSITIGKKTIIDQKSPSNAGPIQHSLSLERY